MPKKELGICAPDVARIIVETCGPKTRRGDDAPRGLKSPLNASNLAAWRELLSSSLPAWAF